MLDNKYYQCYLKIIANAKMQTRSKKDKTFKFENHHIVPESMGGDNSKSNLVLLTYKEHYVCHHLLTKCTTGIDRAKMIYAFWSMTNRWGRSDVTSRITGNMYDRLKVEVAKLISANNTGRSYSVSDETKHLHSLSKLGSKNPMYGKPAPNRGIKRPGVGGRKKGTQWSEAERMIHQTVRSAPGYYDYLLDPIRRKKISESSKGRKGAAKGKTWFNNGIQERYADECPAGYTVGRLVRLQPNKKGLRWYNNGQVNRQFRDGSVDEGFVRGRIAKK